MSGVRNPDPGGANHGGSAPVLHSSATKPNTPALNNRGTTPGACCGFQGQNTIVESMGSTKG